MFVLCCLAHKTAVVSAVVFVLFRSFIPLLFVISAFRRKRVTGPKVFDLLMNVWSERRDLNSGPPVPQDGAPKRNSQVITITYAVLRGPLRWFLRRFWLRRCLRCSASSSMPFAVSPSRMWLYVLSVVEI